LAHAGETPADRNAFFKDRAAEVWEEWDAMRQGKAPPSEALVEAVKLTAEQCDPGEEELVDQYGVRPRDYANQPAGRMGPVFGGALLKTREDILRFMEIYGKESFEDYAVKVVGPRKETWHWAPFHNGNVTRFFNDAYPERVGEKLADNRMRGHATQVDSIVRLTDRYRRRLRLPSPCTFIYGKAEKNKQLKMDYQSGYWSSRDARLDASANAQKLFNRDRRREFAAAGLLAPGKAKQAQAPQAEVLAAAIAACQAIAEHPHEQREGRMKMLHDKLHLCRFDIELGGQKAAVYLSFTDRSGRYVDDIRVLPARDDARQSEAQEREADLLEQMRAAVGARAGKECARLAGFPFRSEDLRQAWEKEGLAPKAVWEGIANALREGGEEEKFFAAFPDIQNIRNTQLACPDHKTAAELIATQSPRYVDKQGARYFLGKNPTKVYVVSKFRQRELLVRTPPADLSLPHRTSDRSGHGSGPRR